MIKKTHPDSALIDTVGTKAIYRVFALSPQSLYMWRRRGIPLAKRITFAKLCADQGVTTPDNFFAKFEAGA